MEIKNRNQTGEAADSCLERHTDHAGILTMRHAFVNDSRQGKRMSIITIRLKDKKL
ncbi:MAG: hypothetical protein HYZ23_01555 [Chloroflexi bacterium]|nr:hypothetical protein [Chloroflexota bacterium]